MVATVRRRTIMLDHCEEKLFETVVIWVRILIGVIVDTIAEVVDHPGGYHIANRLIL